jgi:hypothetical protein
VLLLLLTRGLGAPVWSLLLLASTIARRCPDGAIAAAIAATIAAAIAATIAAAIAATTTSSSVGRLPEVLSVIVATLGGQVL